MENIVTTQVRLYLRDVHRAPPVDIYLPLLFNAWGSSYHVPLHVSENPLQPYVDIQYGAKTDPMPGIKRLWRECGSAFDAIWVRYYDESDDHDQIISIDHYNGQSEADVCPYRFDHVRLTWKPTDMPISPRQITKDGHWQSNKNQWALTVRGSYYGANFRADMCGAEGIRPGITTATSPACLMAGGLEWSFFGIRPRFLTLMAQRYPDSFQKVEFYYRRRLVRADVIHPKEPRWGWTFFSLDGWDNCAHRDFLIYQDYYHRKYGGGTDGLNGSNGHSYH